MDKATAEAEANRKAASLIGQAHHLLKALKKVELDDQVRVFVNTTEEAVEVKPGHTMGGFSPTIRIAAVVEANGIGYRDVGRGRLRLDKPC